MLSRSITKLLVAGRDGWPTGGRRSGTCPIAQGCCTFREAALICHFHQSTVVRSTGLDQLFTSAMEERPDEPHLVEEVSAPALGPAHVEPTAPSSESAQMEEGELPGDSEEPRTPPLPGPRTPPRMRPAAPLGNEFDLDYDGGSANPAPIQLQPVPRRARTKRGYFDLDNPMHAAPPPPPGPPPPIPSPPRGQGTSL